jgi:ABC-type transport system involved in multi-copper enzyme maturation permease subunit
MWTRLRKEIRALLPFFALAPLLGGFALIAAYAFAPTSEYMHLFLRSLRDFYQVVLILLAVCSLVLVCFSSAELFGQEFKNGSIQRLLAQPLSRNRIWLEKLLAPLLLLCLSCLILSLVYFFLRAGLDRRASLLPVESGIIHILNEAKYRMGLFHLRSLFYLFTLGLVEVGTASWLSLTLKQTHTTFWGALVLPVLFAMVVIPLSAFIDNYLSRHFGVSLRFLVSTGWDGVDPDLWPLPIAWILIVFPLGWLKFRKLEV